jgi:hypothetical protein
LANLPSNFFKHTPHFLKLKIKKIEKKIKTHIEHFLLSCLLLPSYIFMQKLTYCSASASCLCDALIPHNPPPHPLSPAKRKGMGNIKDVLPRLMVFLGANFCYLATPKKIPVRPV